MMCESTRKMTPDEQLCYELGYKKGKLDSVVRGHWIDLSKEADPHFICSTCSGSLDVENANAKHPYCPSCGAKLQQEATE